MTSRSVLIEVYRWAGKWGPFRIKIPCGECALTGAIIEDTLKKECAGMDAEVVTRDWLTYWWRPLLKGGYHAPIVLVEGKMISQGLALNRGLFTQAVVEAWTKRTPLKATHVFGKADCGFCKQAKETLADKGISFVLHDVVANPKDLYEMISRVKPLIDPKTPVTLPQVWLDGTYIGGAEELTQALTEK